MNMPLLNDRLAGLLSIAGELGRRVASPLAACEIVELGDADAAAAAEVAADMAD